MFEEKRKFQRYPMVGKVVIATKDDRKFITQITNISFSGIRVYSVAPINELTNVAMQVMFTDSRGTIREVPMDGTVLWVAAAGKMYEMGICFSHYLSHQPVLLEHLRQIAARSEE